MVLDLVFKLFFEGPVLPNVPIAKVFWVLVRKSRVGKRSYTFYLNPWIR